MRREPEPLRRGKKFHALVQAEWRKQAEGEVKPEEYVLQANGRKGRVDIFVGDPDPDGCIAIVEIKATDFDSMTARNVRRNVRRHIRQVWRYVESQIKDGRYVETGAGQSVTPGIIYSQAPSSQERKELIEELYGEEGIVLVWHDELDSH